MVKKDQKTKKMTKDSSKKAEVISSKAESHQKGQQLKKGRVVSVKLSQTAIVLIERREVHPLYKKAFSRSKRYMVQDELGVKDGDLVEICKIRPISKNKHWKIVRVVGRDIKAIVAEQLKEEAQEVIEQVMPVVEEKEESEKSTQSLQASDLKELSTHESIKEEKPKKSRSKKEDKGSGTA